MFLVVLTQRYEYSLMCIYLSRCFSMDRTHVIGSDVSWCSVVREFCTHPVFELLFGYHPVFYLIACDVVRLCHGCKL